MARCKGNSSFCAVIGLSGRGRCPACGQRVEAVVADGRVRGYCAFAKQSVDFLTETQPVGTGEHPASETKAKISVALTHEPKRLRDRGETGGAEEGLVQVYIEDVGSEVHGDGASRAHYVVPAVSHQGERVACAKDESGSLGIHDHVLLIPVAPG